MIMRVDDKRQHLNVIIRGQIYFSVILDMHVVGVNTCIAKLYNTHVALCFVSAQLVIAPNTNSATSIYPQHNSKDIFF